MPKAKTTAKPKAKTTATAKPKASTYKVKTKSGAPLALRTAPDADSELIIWIPNDSEITVSEMVNGESFDESTEWAHATFKGHKGYCTATRLIKI